MEREMPTNTTGGEWLRKHKPEVVAGIEQAAERRIVEWLRWSDGKRDFGRPNNIADAIERGEHHG